VLLHTPDSEKCATDFLDFSVTRKLTGIPPFRESKRDRSRTFS
jgi:hypothetical protein